MCQKNGFEIWLEPIFGTKIEPTTLIKIQDMCSGVNTYHQENESVKHNRYIVYTIAVSLHTVNFTSILPMAM
jgi:hypothetical protein